MDLRHEIRDRELDLVGTQATRLVARDEPDPRSDVLEDRGGLRDDHVAVPQRGRAERCEVIAGALEQPLDGGHASSPRPGSPSDVVVRDASVLEGAASSY